MWQAGLQGDYRRKGRKNLVNAATEEDLVHRELAATSREMAETALPSRPAITVNESRLSLLYRQMWPRRHPPQLIENFSTHRGVPLTI